MCVCGFTLARVSAPEPVGIIRFLQQPFDCCFSSARQGRSSIPLGGVLVLVLESAPVMTEVNH